MHQIYEKSKNLIEINFQRNIETILAFLFSQIIFSYLNENYFSFISIYGKVCLYLLFFSVLFFSIFSIKKVKFDLLNLLIILISLFCFVSIIYNNEFTYSLKEFLKIIFLLFLYNICNDINIDKFYRNFTFFFKIFFSLFILVIIFGYLKFDFFNQYFQGTSYSSRSIYEEEGISYYFLKLYFSNYFNLLAPFNAFVHYYLISLFLIFNLKNVLKKNLIFLIFNLLFFFILFYYFDLTLIFIFILISLFSYFIFTYLKSIKIFTLKLLFVLSISIPFIIFSIDSNNYISRIYSKFLYNYSKVINANYSAKYYLKNNYFVYSYDFDNRMERYHPRIPKSDKFIFSINQKSFEDYCLPTFLNNDLDLFDFLIEDIRYEDLELNDKKNFKDSCKSFFNSENFFELKKDADYFLNTTIKHIDKFDSKEKEYYDRILSQEYPFILIDWNYITKRKDLPPFYQVYYSLKSRSYIIKQHTNIIYNNLAFGLGGYIPSRDWNINNVFRELDQNKPHNSFVSIAEMYGIFTFLIFCLIIYMLINKILKNKSINYSNYAMLIFFLLMCSVEDYMVGASFNTFAIGWLSIFLTYHKKNV